MAAVCRRQFGPDRSAEGFEEAERRVREGVHALGCEVLGAFVEDRDDGASRIERDGQCWFRVAATPKTIMTTLGPVRYRRARYRNGASRASLVPVDDSLGLVDDYLTRPAACLGLLMMGHASDGGQRNTFRHGLGRHRMTQVVQAHILETGLPPRPKPKVQMLG